MLFAIHKPQYHTAIHTASVTSGMGLNIVKNLILPVCIVMTLSMQAFLTTVSNMIKSQNKKMLTWVRMSLVTTQDCSTAQEGTYVGLPGRPNELLQSRKESSTLHLQSKGFSTMSAILQLKSVP